MAFAFFRRRQKLVLIIMVFLMVVFLVPTGIRGLFSGRHKTVIGNIGRKGITLGLVKAGKRDLRIIRRELGLMLSRWPGQSMFELFIRINNEDKLPLAWVLLVHEAEQMGITVSDSQVEAFLKQQKLTDQTYQDEIANLNQLGFTERDLHQAISHYLMVMTAFESAAVSVPPSLPELKHVFRDLYERINLAMIAFPAEDFVVDAPEPSEQTIREWFERYKTLLPNHPSNKTDFRFGYRRPDRLDVAWLFIERDKVYAAIEPSDKQMISYWRQHKGELKKLVPIKTTATRPTGPTTNSSGGTVATTASTTQESKPKFREVIITQYSQAKPQIRKILKQQFTEVKMGELIAVLQKRIRQLAKKGDTYASVVKSMIHTAETPLARRIPAMPFTSAGLKMVIEQLGQITGIKIVYPIGKFSMLSIDGDVSIRTSDWKNITLAEALESIEKQLKLPHIKWVTCEGFTDVIFPRHPVNLVPISSGRTGLVSFETIARDEILGNSYLARKAERFGNPGGDLLSIAATARVFPATNSHHAPIEIGSDYGQAMYVVGPKQGRLLWRLLAAEPSHTPAQLTAEIRREVIRDIKIAYGFKKALKTARTLKAEIDKTAITLDKVASAKKKTVMKTGFFTRKTFQSATGRISWSYVPGVGVNRYFIEKAFSLAPRNPDEPVGDKPTAVVELYHQHEVMLIQMIGYEPVTKALFDQVGARLVTSLTMLTRWRQQVVNWFFAENVIKRVGYVSRFSM